MYRCELQTAMEKLSHNIAKSWDIVETLARKRNYAWSPWGNPRVNGWIWVSFDLEFFYGWLQSTIIRVLNSMTKVTFIFFFYVFKRIVSEYLHIITQKDVLNLFFINVNFLCHSSRKYHFGDRKLIRARKTLCQLYFFLKICTVVWGSILV